VSLLAPAALGLLALSIPLVVLYMLRSRRQRLVVSSVRLWEGEEEYVSAALPWQRLKITAALLLQLLTLAAFALLLARPFYQEATPLGPHTVVVIDTSGSMALAGRLEAAKSEARSLIVDVSEAQLVSLIEAGPRARVLAAFARDPNELRSQIDALVVSGGVEDLDGALRLARGLATPDRATSILLLTDGGIEGMVAEPIGNARHLLFDDVEDNVAITAFGAGAPGEGVARLFLEVTSFSASSTTAEVETRVDGLQVGTTSIRLEPGQRAQRYVPVDAGPGQVVEAEILANSDGNPLDDEAAAVLGANTYLTIAVMGEGSPFLDALVASLSGFGPAAGTSPDLVIRDGGSAAEVDRPTWLIAPVEPPPGVTITGRLENPVVTYQRSGEPLLDGLDLSELMIAEADIVQARGWLPLVQAGDVPLVLLGEVAGHRVVYFTFDLVRSNLPLQVSFPILGARIIEWLGGGQVSTAATAIAGAPIPLAPPAGSRTQITMPDGGKRELDGNVIEFLDTGQPGIYTVAYVAEDGATTGGFVAARQFAAAEAAGSSRRIATVSDEVGELEETTLLREWAPLILALILGLVLIEWWVAFGRPLPRFRKAEA
jgi:hypothetical protein